MKEPSKSMKIVAYIMMFAMLFTIVVPTAYVSAETAEPSESQAAAGQETDAQKAPSGQTEDSVSSSETITQTVHVEKVSVPEAAKLTVGQTKQMKASVAPSNAANKKVTWKSSNTEVAKVSASGKVTAKGAGSAAITAQAANGKNDTCKVAVSLTKPTKAKAASGCVTVIMKWKKVTGADGYKIYRATKKNGAYKAVKSVKGGSTLRYKSKNHKVGKYYYYKVRAYQEVNGKTKYSDYSSSVSVKMRPIKTAVKLKAGEEKMKVSWKRVPGAQGYHVYRSSSKNGKYKGVEVAKGNSDTSCVDAKLKGGKAYYYKVRAYRKAGGEKVLALSSDPVKKVAKKSTKKTSPQGFHYKKKFKVKAYAYTGGGLTAMGTRARVGAIAVDPRVIPLGTKVYVEGYGFARAEDTGGNIKGRTVDLYKSSSSACYNWGVRYKTIYIL